MSMLYLWHPAVSETGKEVDLILTRGDSDQVGGGSERFVNALLGILRVEATAQKWSLRSFRCNYYSEYWMEEGWESKWDFVWRMTLHFREPVAVQALNSGYLGIDEIDDYSPLVESYKYEPFGCLAVAAFLSQQQAVAAATRLMEDGDLKEARRAVGAPAPMSQVVGIGAGKFQLRAVLGSGDEAFFKSQYPELVLSLLERGGGVIHAEG